MATELQRQVAAIKSKHVHFQSLSDGKPSIFLTAREAASVDVTTVYDAAITGLKVLMQYDPRFEKFLNTILHPSSVSVQRELKTKDENAELDTEIEQLLSLLSLWAFEANAHLVLEYLIRRYLIHEYNTEALLKSLLVSHDTKIFGKVVQLCRLQETRWVFLSPVKESGLPFPRSLLVKKVIKSPWVIEVIAQIAINALQLIGIRKSVGLFSISPLVIQGAERILSFATAVILETAEQVAFDDSKIRNIYIFLLEGLKLMNNDTIFITEQSKLLLDWKCACCLIISQLSRKTSFADSLRRVMANAFAECFRSLQTFQNDEEMYEKLNAILFQTCFILSEKGILDYTKRFVKEMIALNQNQQLLNQLIIIQEDDNGEDGNNNNTRKIIKHQPFIAQLLKKLIDLLVKSDVIADNNNSLEDNTTFGSVPIEKDNTSLDYQLIANTISDLLKQDEILSVLKILVSQLIQQLITSVSFHGSAAYPENRIELMKKVIKLFAQRNPTHFDEIVTSMYRFYSKKQNKKNNLDESEEVKGGKDDDEAEQREAEEQKNKITNLLNEIFHTSSSSSSSSSYFQSANSHDIYLSLHSPIKQFRLEALKKFLKKSEIFNELFVRNDDDDEKDIKNLNHHIQWLSSWILSFLLANPSQFIPYQEEKKEVDEDQEEDKKILMTKSFEKLISKLKKRSYELFHRLFPHLLVITEESSTSSSSKKSKSKESSGQFIQSAEFIEKEIIRNLLEIHSSSASSTSNKKKSSMNEEENSKKQEYQTFFDSFLFQSQFNENSFVIQRLLSFMTNLSSSFLEKNVLTKELANQFLLPMSHYALFLTNADQSTENNNSSATNSILLKYFEMYSLITSKYPIHSDREEGKDWKISLFFNLCLTNNFQFYDLIDPFLNYCFQSFDNYFLFLFHILQLSTSSTSAQLYQLSSKEEIIAVQLILYQIIISSLNTADENKNDNKKNNKKNNNDHRSLFVYLIPMIIFGSSHSHSKIRDLSMRGAEFLAKEIEEIQEKKLNIDHLSIQYSSLIQFTSIIFNKSEMILAQSEASIPLFIDSLNNHSSYHDLHEDLWKVVAYFFQLNKTTHDSSLNFFCVSIILSILKKVSTFSESFLHYFIEILETFLKQSSLSSSSSSILFTDTKNNLTIIDDILRMIQEHFHAFSDKFQNQWIEFMQKIISTSSVDNLHFHQLKIAFLQFLSQSSRILKEKISSLSSLQSLIQLLFHQYLSSASSSSSTSSSSGEGAGGDVIDVKGNKQRELNYFISSTLATLPLNLDLFVQELSKEKDIFASIVLKEVNKQANLHNSSTSTNPRRRRNSITDEDMEVIPVAHEPNYFLNASVAKIVLIMELLNQSFSSLTSSKYQENTELMMIAYSLISIFNENYLFFVNYQSNEENAFSTNLEYIYSLLIENIALQLEFLTSKNYFQSTNGSAAAAATTTPSKKKASAAVTSTSYGIHRFQEDSQILLKSLALLKNGGSSSSVSGMTHPNSSSSSSSVNATTSSASSSSLNYQLFIVKIMKYFFLLAPSLGTSLFPQLSAQLLSFTSSRTGTHQFHAAGLSHPGGYSLPYVEKILLQLLDLRVVYLDGMKKNNHDDNEKELLKNLQFTSMNILCFDLLKNFIDLQQQERQIFLRSIMKVIQENHLAHQSASSSSKMIEEDDEDEEDEDEEMNIFFSCMFNGLICQTIASYENQDTSSAQQQQQQSNGQKTQVDTIALSRAAQRRANRAMVTSLPEQFYQLAHYLFFHMPATLQIKLLIHLIADGDQYYSFAVNTSSNSSGGNHHQQQSAVNSALNYLQSLILKSSTAMLITSHKPGQEQQTNTTNDDNNDELLFQGYAATISMIYMEFLLEILENKKFHRNLVRSIQHQQQDSIELQHDLLTLTDHFLQFIISIEKSRQHFSSNAFNQQHQHQKNKNLNNQTMKKLLLRVEHETFFISKDSLADIIFNTSLNCIAAFQILLDMPSFLSIIQELLNHDLLTVRQRAIVILKDRLQETNLEKIADIELFYDLFLRMKSLVMEHCQEISIRHQQRQQAATTVSKTPSKGKKNKSEETTSTSSIEEKEQDFQLFVTKQHQNIPLIQSAILCMDLLLQYLGKTLSWKSDILALLTHIMTMIPILYQEIEEKKTLEFSSILYIDYKKLLGSFFLFIATNFRILGANLLSFFPNTMKLFLTIFTNELSLWKQLTTRSIPSNNNNSMMMTTTSSSSGWNKIIPEFKSQVLFLRTLIMSLNIFMDIMSNFIHNYLKDIMILFFQFHAMNLIHKIHKEFQLLSNDIQISLQLIISKIPIRLFIPLFNDIIHEIYQMKSLSAVHIFMEFFTFPFIQQIDRSSLVTFFHQWVTISIDLLQFRSKFVTLHSINPNNNSMDDEDEIVDEIEQLVTSSIKEIALKLTEKELKAFILKLLDWKNKSISKDGDDDESQQEEDNEDESNLIVYHKSIAFYSMINELVKTLKQLFNSTMNLLWDDYSDHLQEIKENIESLVNKATSAIDPSSKKRKKLIEIREKLGVKDNFRLNTYEKYNSVLLLLIQSLSDNGRGTFINETRYEKLYPITLYYLSLREISSSDDLFLQNNQDTVIPTLIQLCLSVNRDLLWKPLNYQILLLTRHSLSIVRKIAVIAIGKLFQEVGDDYLHLLPECIQFISELLEDSHQDVVNATRETITIIEDLSGEKLDTFLAH